MPAKKLQKVRLGSVATLVTSGSRDWAKYYSDTGSKFVRMTNLRRNDIRLKTEDMKYVCLNDKSTEGRRTSLQHGDILMSITAELGKIGWIPNDFGEAYINQHTALIRINTSRADSRYIAYLLASRPMNNIINRMNDAGAKAALNLSTVRGLPLEMPDLNLQVKIAEILSTYDRAIETVEKLINNSKAQKNALMQQLLTGKKRLPGFSDEWSATVLSNIATILVSPVNKKNVTGEAPVCLCNYTDVYYNSKITNSLDFMTATASPSEIKRFSLKKNDVVITKDSETPGDIAVPALVSEELDGVVCGYHLAIIRPDTELVVGTFLNHLFSQPRVRYYFSTRANGATRFGLTIDGIRDASFMLPNITEQTKIARILDACNQELQSLNELSQDLETEKRGLMQQLLTGKIRTQA